jgi:hypothetical protein
LAAASLSALELSRRKITHTSTSICAMPVRSSAPIALRYSVSIRGWAHMKLIPQIVPTVTWTELKSSNLDGVKIEIFCVILVFKTWRQQAHDMHLR